MVIRGDEIVEKTSGWKRGLEQFLVIAAAIVFFFLLFKFNDILHVIFTILGTIKSVIIGLILAFLLHPVVRRMELWIIRLYQKIKKTDTSFKAARGISILLVFLIITWVLYLLGSLVFPELYGNIRNLVAVLPSQAQDIVQYVEIHMHDNEQLTQIIQTVTTQVTEYLDSWLHNDLLSQANDLIGNVISRVFGVATIALDVIVGLIVSVYVLTSTEVFARQGKKVLYAFCKPRYAEIILTTLKKSDEIFTGFISGKIIDSLIIGILCAICMTILNMPYVVLVSVIVGVTNIIPFFGPYIGAIPSTILILLENPTKGVLFIIFIVILQQVDGNIIGPKILGQSTGLSPFWVVFSILFFGGMFGLLGMIIGVPTFGVIYYIIKTYVNYKLEKKQISETDLATPIAEVGEIMKNQIQTEENDIQ